jgi:integrase
MFNLTFNLKESKSNQPTLIFLYVTVNNQRIKLSTRQKILPDLWNFDQRAVTKSRIKLKKYESKISGISEGAAVVRQKLNDLRKEVERYFFEKSLSPEEANAFELRDYLLKYLIPPKINVLFSTQVIHFLSVFIQEATEGKRKQANGKCYKLSTLGSYKSLFSNLTKFEKHLRRKFTWDIIDRKVYSLYVNWNEEKGLALSTIGKHIKNLKSTMRMAFEDGVHHNEEFRKRYFIVLKNYKKRTPLSLNEIKKLLELDLPKGSVLDFSRDIFLIGCYTGLRVSDIKRISPNHIRQDVKGMYLEIRTLKTETDLKIPLNQNVIDILTKYTFRIPKFWEQVVNRNLKLIAPRIGLKEDRAKRLSIHVSRHSFARLAYEIGIPSLYIMKITGHQSERNFLRYVNIAPEEAIEEFRKHSFFN